ncbi:LptF/LptG family permease [Phorcysia thermohydrogeniphila]|uniref:Lipopolysaccharide export system permease protein n=1 Tax=Phorcysia thermohydrogeniphila TaxID=936138 RepID=A0A4R1GHB3_9BACT|nr:LptF/LptG family permease [Phorcysia thermohydrogeniphila]TCK06421.1 lipopolysaccharide export system permease protein [Phorcysia thermohydrogeniphila]
MVKTLDRYVFKESFKFFILALSTFLVLFVVIDFVSNVDTFMKAGLKEGFTYVLSRLPLYAVRVIPIAVLIATMVTMSSFSSTSELTAVKALGISVYRFSLPIICLGLAASFTSLFLQEFIVPPTVKVANEIKFKALGKKKKELFVSAGSLWFRTADNRFVYMERFFPESGRAERISIFKVTPNFVPVERIDAESGENVEGSTWELKKCYLRNLEKLSLKFRKKMEVNLGIDRNDLVFSKIEPETMGVVELFLFVKQLGKIGYDVTPFLVEMYSKLSLSFLPVVVAVIGIPLGVFNPRNRKGYTLVIAVLLIVSMWITISFFLSLGKSGVLPPFYSAFAPLFLFLSVGLVLLARTET